MKNKHLLNTFFYSCVASLGGFLFGYHTAIISGALFFISSTFNLSIFQQEFLVSLILLGALIGSWTGGTISDSIGRKKTFFVSVFFLIFGTILFVTSKDLSVFFISRMINGFSIGIFSAVTPIYIAEISQPRYRGRLVSMNQLFLVFGILISNISGYFFSKTQNWQAMFLFGLIFAFLMLFLLFFIPETPSFLISHNNENKAFEVLKKISNDLNDTEILHKNPNSKKIGWTDLLSKGVRSAFFVGIGINIFRQITGINVVTYYAPKIFQAAGFENHNIAMFATMLVTTVNFIASIISLWLIDKCGRRPLLITGITGMIFSLFTISLIFNLFHSNSSFLIIIALMLFVSSFAISFGSISWVINSEIYPKEIRGRAVGISTLANWICNYLVSISFLSLMHNFGTGNTFLLYGTIAIIALVFVIKKAPETKGKNLVEIQEFFNK
jgi:MFS transporter, SP family, galactose:H+ symporter